jgi:hypothetical protein
MKNLADIPVRITPDMTVLDVLSCYGETETVFRRYDALAGECICCRALFDTLKDMSCKYNLDLEELMSNLREAVRLSRKKE